MVGWLVYCETATRCIIHNARVGMGIGQGRDWENMFKATQSPSSSTPQCRNNLPTVAFVWERVGGAGVEYSVATTVTTTTTTTTDGILKVDPFVDICTLGGVGRYLFYYYSGAVSTSSFPTSVNIVNSVIDKEKI